MKLINITKITKSLEFIQKIRVIRTLLNSHKVDNTTKTIYFIAGVVSLIATAYLAFYFQYLSSEIPLWSSLPWGIYRISVKQYIFIIPLINLFVLGTGVYFSKFYSKYNIREVSKFVGYIILFCSLFVNYSLISIVNRTKMVSYNFSSWFYDYTMPALFAAIVAFLVGQLVLKYAEKLKIVEYPSLRDEPAKILSTPTPRGGAIVFFTAFAITALLFIGTSQRVVGLIIGTAITTLAGYLDDRFKLHYLPRLLLLLPLASIVVILSGFVMLYIPNPIGDPIKLDLLRYSFELYGQRSIIIYGAIAAFVWFMWMTNMVSWNNGVDGQFAMITGITTLVIGILSLRFQTISYEAKLSAQIAFISFGAIATMLYYTFPPQKLLWGFGATSVGLIIGAISLLSGTRVSTAILLLLIPSIDTIYVIASRIKHKKSPFMGDRSHLHHKLIDLGWSKLSITLFYMAITILCGLISIFISEQAQLLTLVTVTGVVLYGIIVIRQNAKKIIKEK